MFIKIKDGSKVDVEANSKVIDVAKKISEGLARNAVAGKVNGKMCQLSQELQANDLVEIVTLKDAEGMEVLRHSTAHVLALAVKRKFPGTKISIGPAIENGFYYDFDFAEPIGNDDLPVIEAEMEKIIKDKTPFVREEISRDEAVKLFKKLDEPYKLAILAEIPADEKLTIYKLGELIDLCRGPHLEDISLIKAFKLQSVTGAYFQGNEKNKMLTRIYGTSFPKKSELDDYLARLEEAKKRDHRKLAKELGLFMFSDAIGKGLPLWLPKGFLLRQTLCDYLVHKELHDGYKHVLTPYLASTNLYHTSGHWEHYKDDMFPPMKMENEEYVLRPMSCPHHMMIYKNSFHSYKDLPLRIAEIGNVFRFEDSGTLTGIERDRWFCQNDAHIFCRPDQIHEECDRVVKLILGVYKDLGINEYKFRLSLRDKDSDKYFPNDELWEKSESALRQILIDNKVDFYEAKGEAAFYGPKIDIQAFSVIGHEVSISTLQLDYQLPLRFGLEYIGENGEKETPVVLHRAVFGSLDRFIALLIEKFAGAFPLWMSPVQVQIITISEKQNDYAREVFSKLNDAGIRVEFDDRNEKVGYKIREAQLQKVPYMLVLGDEEMTEKKVAVRHRKEGDLGKMTFDEFLSLIRKEIDTKEIK